MPPQTDFNKIFVQQILTGDKKVLRRANVRSIAMPHYDELSAKKIIELVREDALVQQYMKDEWVNGK